MDQTGLMNKVYQRLHSEKLNTDAEHASPLRAATNLDRADLLNLVKEAGKTKSIDLILKLEKAFLVNDLRLYGNSPDMKGSLSEAITGVDQTNKMLTFVRDPKQYNLVNETHALKKSRKGAVPYDEARKFFPGQVMRLKNMDKSRLSAEEKKIITARQDNLRVAEKVYKALQHTALGVSMKSPAQSRDKSHGLEMG